MAIGDEVAPADDQDTWYRHVLISGHIKKNGEPHFNFFKAFSPPKQNRHWAMEISGRMLSKSFDVREMAENAAAELQANLMVSGNTQKASFRGVVYSKVKNIRSATVQCFDVFEEPTNDDGAHANLTSSVNPPPPLKPNGKFDWQDHMSILKELVISFRAELPENLSNFESLRFS